MQKEEEIAVLDFHQYLTKGKDTPTSEREKFFIGDVWSNTAKCRKCGDIISSLDRHHLQYCSCQSIFVDGGSHYARRGGQPEDIIEMCQMFSDVESLT